MDKNIPVNLVSYKKQVSFNRIIEILKSDSKNASSCIVKAPADDKRCSVSKESHDKKNTNTENLDKKYGDKNYNLDSSIDSIYLSK